MMYGAMNKTTIYLPDDLRSGLKRLATETGRSEADIIREGIRLALAERTRPKPRGGIFDSGLPDLAQRVDEYLAKGFGRD
jgi:hypothetical protein